MYTQSLPNLGPPTASVLPQIQVFRHINFNRQLGDRNPEGDKPTDENILTTFNVDLDGDDLNEGISSFIIYSGYWQFFKNVGFQDPFPKIYGPGHYPKTADIGMENDTISSFKLFSVEKPAHPDVYQ
ncbi:hypothetical protein GO755_10530 [Spirosoma sp. HMF4905]|uniref:Beta/gamma crystallin 'Greek key' domain-containing protein n=1 Tax=Spirosoma arboris TaxID=2682092 RepID=A0A7K1S9L8_9BACT|nr:beta/gamma crystallin-related protein [Spirosoma arboris]MVM30470.1 hypothetical protein [Spirosoma arboris]